VAAKRLCQTFAKQPDVGDDQQSEMALAFVGFSSGICLFAVCHHVDRLANISTKKRFYGILTGQAVGVPAAPCRQPIRRNAASEAALSRQMSIGHFRRRISPSAVQPYV
jgi:hypothetical protein